MLTKKDYFWQYNCGNLFIAKPWFTDAAKNKTSTASYPFLKPPPWDFSNTSYKKDKLFGL